MNASQPEKTVQCSIDCTSDAMPDACGNDIREEKLLQRQTRRQEQSWIVYFMNRERYLLIAGLILIFFMNTSTGRYVLYPFQIFSTWVHEMCHGMAAILSGGYIVKLQIFHDGSGLATTAASQHRGFVAAAGYPGTSVTGGLLLLFRRTTLGPTIGIIGLGLALLLSVVLYVRNQWGIIVLTLEGLVLLGCGWKLPAAFLDNLYSFLALTVSLNAIENIRDLYGSDEGYVNGELRNTDAHTVAEIRGGDYRLWATRWLLLSVAMSAFGIFFARNARSLPWNYASNNHYGTSVHDQQLTYHSNNNSNNTQYTQGNVYVAMPSDGRKDPVDVPVAIPITTLPVASAPTEAQLKSHFVYPSYVAQTV